MVSRNWLLNKYNSGLSYGDIAKIVGVSNVTIRNWTKIYGIKKRTLSEQMSITNKKTGKWKGKNNPSIKNRKNFLLGIAKRDLSGEKNPMFGKKHSKKSKEKMRDKSIGRIMKEETKEKQSNAIKGEKHYNWKGGLSKGEYHRDWVGYLKTKIRKRDKFTCAVCKKNGFVVHHIDYDKQNCDEKNLITLCRSCHTKTNFNREKWIKYFINN